MFIVGTRTETNNGQRIIQRFELKKEQDYQ